jgi:hypothetical protein
MDVLRVHEMRASHRFGEGFLPFWRRNQVHVIGHEAVRRHRQPVPLRALPEKGQVYAPVVVGEEDILAIVAPLGDVMSHSGNDDSRLPCHGKRLPREIRIMQQRVTVPIYPRAFTSNGCSLNSFSIGELVRIDQSHDMNLSRPMTRWLSRSKITVLNLKVLFFNG